VLDMVGIAAVRYRPREPPAHTDITLRLPQQQCPAIGSLPIRL
jgi:Na+-translocating ferredoxin:NAD+ oxidoreductase RNF subunit RnfB